MPRKAKSDLKKDEKEALQARSEEHVVMFSTLYLYHAESRLLEPAS